ncbi:hypothetical protein [Paraburkholderia aspalathi]|uniref:hypothetical protein n=1 Tax=Paraburkholderia aspalathi TaxID=1324617 RepID=UPI001ABFE9BC|nr:hypothetical protein [Paraburkholderia aspalathi]
MANVEILAPKPPSFAALVRQFFTELSLRDVERALAVPMMRFEQPMLNYLARAEIVVVLGQAGES